MIQRRTQGYGSAKSAEPVHLAREEDQTRAPTGWGLVERRHAVNFPSRINAGSAGFR